MEVYADLLFLENLTVNYFILLATSKIAKVNTMRPRMLGSAFLGSLGVFVYLFFPNISIWTAIIYKIGLSLILVYVAYPIENIRQMTSVLSAFYICTFAFAGVVLAFIYAGPLLGDDVYYYLKEGEGRKILTLILSGIAVLILLKTFGKMFRRRIINDSMTISIIVGVDDKTVEIPAFLDTGNFLCDPITKVPVVVAEYEAIKYLLPDDLKNTYKENIIKDWESIIKIFETSSWRLRFRFIPFQSLGNENGMLLGFKPDYVKIHETKGGDEIIIAIYSKSLSGGKRGNEYGAIIGPELI